MMWTCPLKRYRYMTRGNDPRAASCHSAVNTGTWHTDTTVRITDVTLPPNEDPILLALALAPVSVHGNHQELMNKAMEKAAASRRPGGMTIEENTDPFTPLGFTGTYRMEVHNYKNGAEEKDSPMIRDGLHRRSPGHGPRTAKEKGKCGW